MKLIGVAEAKNNLSEVIEEAREAAPVVITNHGKPAALLVGLHGLDLEDVIRMADPEFWAGIDRTRRETKSYSLAEMKRRHLKRKPRK